MTRVLRYLVRKFYTLCAIALIALAVLVQCGRSFSPLVSEYRQELSDYLSAKLNADVQIGAINAQWEGLKPVVDARNIRITSHSGESILALEKARMRLDLVSSLVKFRLVWGSIDLRRVNLEFEQTSNGFWRLPGLAFENDKAPQEAAQLDVVFDMLLLANHIEFHQSHLSFRFIDDHQIAFDSPSVRLENKNNFHRLSLQVDIEEQKEAVAIVVEGRGDPRDQKRFRAHGYVQLNEFPTSEPLAAAGALLLPGIDDLQWRSDGSLNAHLWFGSRARGEGFDLTGQLGLQALSLPVLGRRLDLASFNTDVDGYWLPNGRWQLALQNISADVNKTRIDQLSLAVSASALNGPLLLQTDKVNLRRWTQILNDAGAFGSKKLQEVMLALNPKGELRNVQITLPLDKPRAWQLQANAHKVGVNAWHGVPALTKVDGFIQAGQTGGYINLDSRNGFSMHYDRTYSDAMVYEQASGQVAWWLQPEKNQIYVNSGPIKLRNGAEDATGYLWLALPWQRNTGDVDLYLHIGARNLAASLYKKYTPAVVPRSLLNWLEQSIGDHNNGVVSEAGFVYRGTLNTKNLQARSHQLYLNIEHAELNYHADWPALRDLSGRLLVNDNQVDASVAEGKLYSSELHKTRLRSRPNPSGEGALLTIEGQVSGPAGDGLRVLRESMLRQYIGDNMDQWSLDGNMAAQLAIAVPLGAGANGARQQIDVDLDASAFELKNFDLSLQDLAGRISYNNQRGLSSRQLGATLFGEKISVDLSSENQQGVAPQTVIAINGNIKHQRLAEWSKRPELLFLDGTIPYETRIELIHRTKDAPTETKSNDDSRVANISINSNLKGVAVDLPAPYGKTPRKKRLLNVNLQLNQKTTLIDVSYGIARAQLSATGVSANAADKIAATDTHSLDSNAASIPEHALQALFSLQRDGNQLLAANVALASRAALSNTKQFLLSGYLSEFDLEQWQNVQERYSRYSAQIVPPPARGKSDEPAASTDDEHPVAELAQPIADKMLDTTPDKTAIAGLPFRANLVLGSHRLGPLELRHLALDIMPLADSWQVDFTNPILAGRVRLPNAKTEPIDIALKYLHLSRSAFGEQENEIKTLETEFDPRSLPRANVSITALYFDESNYGNWSLQLRPKRQGTLFDNIRGNIRGITISGVDADAENAQEKGAQLLWRVSDTGTKTRFVGLLSAENIGEVMQQWGKPDIIESKLASYKVDLSWPGAPQELALVNLKGNIDLLMQDGRFKRNPGVGSDGFLRLVALVNFDTLARRLRLDFSDLYKSGLAYDQLQGNVTFDSGKLFFTEPLQVTSPSSRLHMAGSINLQNETIDTRLVATLPVAGNLTFLAALATGLPAAAGVYLISKIFKKQVDQATSISYRISGSWDEPKMEFDRLFESENSLRNIANQNGDTKVQDAEPLSPESLQ